MQKWRGLFGAAIPPLETRHVVSGSNTRFNAGQLSFSDYMSMNRDMIRKIRSPENPDTIDQLRLNEIVNGNAPFALEPAGEDTAGQVKKYRRGILLIHGLSDSPYVMRHLAALFQANGFRVLAVLLPGHGTRPGDLLDVCWKDWAKTVAYGTDCLAAETDELYLGGYSAGGALSVYQSLNDPRVRGLFLFAPAFEISHRAAYASLHKLTSWLFPRTKWVDIKPDRDIYKYESFAKNAATQMYKLTRALRDQLQEHALNIPIFSAASEDDKTVNAADIARFMAQQTHRSNRLILYTSDAAKCMQNSADAKIEWVNSMVPELKILSSAHTAILVAPEDEHYGVDGDYANCFHYYPAEMEKYDVCTQQPSTCWLGEITEKNLEAGVLRRLMYNPNYAALKVSLKKFIDNFS